MLREVSRSIVEDEAHWSALAGDADARAPEVGVLLPAVHWRARGGEKPSLLVPPGSAIEFEVEDLGSRNGLVVDGERVAPGERAQNARVLRLGLSLIGVRQALQVGWYDKPGSLRHFRG